MTGAGFGAEDNSIILLKFAYIFYYTDIEFFPWRQLFYEKMFDNIIN